MIIYREKLCLQMLNVFQVNRLQSGAGNQVKISSFSLSDLLASFLILICGILTGFIFFLIEMKIGKRVFELPFPKIKQEKRRIYDLNKY